MIDLIVYLVVFAFTSLLFFIGDRIEEKSRIFLDILSISILCMLAALRSGDVGTDTGGYFQPMINAAISTGSIKEYMEESWIVAGWSKRIVSQYEIGFSMVVWIISKLSGSVVAVQFFIQALIVGPLYYVVRKSKCAPVWLCMLAYDLLLFNNSLNVIRQSVACSFVVLSLYFWSVRDRLKCFIWMAVAVLFHKSALLGILIILLYEFVQRDNVKDINLIDVKQDDKAFRVVFVTVVGIMLLVGIKFIIRIANIMGFANYTGYLGGGASIKLMPNQIISRLPGLLIILLNYNNLKKHTDKGPFYITMSIYAMIAGHFYGESIVGGAAYGGRIASYFTIYNIFGYSAAASKGKYRTIFTIALIAYMLSYWWFYYVYSGVDATVPYMILGGF